MRRILCLLAACVLSVSTGAAAQYSTRLGPEGEFSTLFYKLEYDPSSACSKPLRPFSDDRYAWELYQKEALRYIDCLKRASEADIKYSQAVIQKGYESAIDDFTTEVELGL